MVDNGWLGKMVDIQMHYDIDMPPWVPISIKKSGTTFKPGGGLCFGLGPHTLDQALTLFGRPATVRAHLRVASDPHSKSDTEDTFDIFLTYPPEQQGLVVEVKTAVVTRLRNQLKYFARGREGTFIKYGEDVQEQQTFAGMDSMDRESKMTKGLKSVAAFGVEPEENEGLLVTSSQVHPGQVQKGKLWEGRLPTAKGNYHGYYRDVAKAIRGEMPLYTTAQMGRDHIRIIELSRESWKQGKTLPMD